MQISRKRYREFALGTVGALAFMLLFAIVTPAVYAANSRTPVTSSHAHVATVLFGVQKSRINATSAPSTIAFAFQVTSTVPAESITLPRLTQPLSATVTPSDTAPIAAEATVTSTTAPATPASDQLTPTADTATESESALDAEYAGPIEGTVIANRTELNVRFFVEGATYQLDPQRSVGLSLPRGTAVLNLFNCDAALPESQAGCYWDPYLLDRDNFYEIVRGADAGKVASLTLQNAGTPLGNQILVQNRTGKREPVFYQGETFELPPSTVHEFTTATDAPAIFYLRSCLELSDRTVCEWAPANANPGYYYALKEMTINGALPGSLIHTVSLDPIFSDQGGPLETAPQLVCQLQVPVLNVRSGPGLEYQIISKIRSSDQQFATVLVVGRDPSSQWLAVDDRVAAGGWVTGSSSFVQCNGDIASLPEAEVKNGELAPTPIPAPAVAEETAPAPAPEAPAEETAPPTQPAPLSIPAGQALIIVNNGFDQQIRFTLDQVYRVELGPSEFDLQPGDSISLLVYPGQIAFSASTPWRGLSGNADFTIEEKESRTLWVVFVPDPDNSGRWLLQY
ncbi:MAG: hypothetical protein R3C14_37525 [Caldilineaceae bacterium]